LGTFVLSLTGGVLTVKGEASEEAARLDLKNAHPCRFHRTSGGKDLRVVIHEGAPVALVVCSRRKNDTDCETVIRSVRPSAKGIELSPKEQRVAACPPTQWDEYMFHWFWYLKKAKQ